LDTTVASIVLAGGKGTRFRQALSTDGQKVLYSVGGKPLIRYTTDLLVAELVDHIIFNVGYKAEDVRDWVKEQFFTQRVSFSHQDEWSTYNAVMNALKRSDAANVVLCNADEIRLGLDLRDVLAFHRQHGRMMTMVAAERDHLSRHRVLQIRSSDNVLLGTEYTPARFKQAPSHKGYVNAGILVFGGQASVLFDSHHSTTGWGALLDPLCRRREIVVYKCSQVNFFNVGTREELDSAIKFLEDA